MREHTVNNVSEDVLIWIVIFLIVGLPTIFCACIIVCLRLLANRPNSRKQVQVFGLLSLLLFTTFLVFWVGVLGWSFFTMLLIAASVIALPIVVLMQFVTVCKTLRTPEWRTKTLRGSTWRTKLKMICTAEMLSIIIFTISPLIGFFSVNQVCANINHARGEQIADAIQIYYEQNTEYPRGIFVLAPRYLAEIPEPTCFRGSFQIYKCINDSGAAVIIPGEVEEIYHLPKGQWDIADDYYPC